MELNRLARDEKDSKILCKLSESFYEEAKSQIRNQEKEAQHLSGLELEIFKECILADKRDLKSINDQRIKKLIKSAVSDAYRDEPKHSLDPMLVAEKEFYDSLVFGIRRLRVDRVTR